VRAAFDLRNIKPGVALDPNNAFVGCCASLRHSGRTGLLQQVRRTEYKKHKMKKIVLIVGSILLAGVAIVTALVETEGNYTYEALGGTGKLRALVLFHPSRDAHFSDELSIAVSNGLMAAGFTVHRATLTQDTPASPKEYALIAVVSNTYWWTPDLPTLRYLARAQFDGIHAIGLLGGAGSSDRSQRLLEESLRQTGAKLLGIRSFWLFQPNDETRMNEANRDVALQMAMQIGMDAGKVVLTSRRPLP
jgi:hypothetical protein